MRTWQVTALLRWASMAILLAGCDFGTTNDATTGTACIEAHPRSGAGDLGGTDPARVESTCTREGHPCDGSRFISQDAARCIAKGAGLEPGIGEWTLSLVYYHGEFQRPVWNVQNLTETRDDGARNGHILTLDAATGDVLQSGGWGGIP